MRHCILLCAVLPLLGCRRTAEPPALPAAVPAQVSLSQFQRLRYLQGSWKGVAPGGEPFYETYIFPSDSVIRSFSYPDSTLGQASDSGLITWSGGRVISGNPEVAWVAVTWDSASVRFAPLRGTVNSFTWAWVSRDAWTARLEWPEGAGRAPLGYTMRRIGP